MFLSQWDHLIHLSFIVQYEKHNFGAYSTIKYMVNSNETVYSSLQRFIFLGKTLAGEYTNQCCSRFQLMHLQNETVRSCCKRLRTFLRNIIVGEKKCCKDDNLVKQSSCYKTPLVIRRVTSTPLDSFVEHH